MVLRRLVLFPVLVLFGYVSLSNAIIADDNFSQRLNCRNELIWPRPVPEFRQAPSYPDRAVSKQIEGWVVMRADILPDGSTTNIEVTESYPLDTFNKTAVRALRKWRYQKRAEGAEAARTWVVITFRLAQYPATRKRVVNTLAEARNRGFVEGDLEGAKTLVDSLSDLEPFRRHEHMLVHQMYGLIAYAANNLDEAIESLLRSGYSETDKSTDVTDLTNQFLVKASVAAEHYCEAVNAFHDWKPSENGQAVYEQMEPTMKQIRSALEAGRLIEMN